VDAVIILLFGDFLIAGLESNHDDTPVGEKNDLANGAPISRGLCHGVFRGCFPVCNCSSDDYCDPNGGLKRRGVLPDRQGPVLHDFLSQLPASFVEDAHSDRAPGTGPVCVNPRPIGPS